MRAAMKDHFDDRLRCHLGNYQNGARPTSAGRVVPDLYEPVKRKIVIASYPCGQSPSPCPIHVEG